MYFKSKGEEIIVADSADEGDGVMHLAEVDEGQIHIMEEEGNGVEGVAPEIIAHLDAQEIPESLSDIDHAEGLPHNHAAVTFEYILSVVSARSCVLDCSTPAE